MRLGAFSISLSVKDIHASKAFYEKLGFSVYAGSIERNYLIMKNQETIVGLFQDMFEGNIMTLNPGWDQSANPLDSYDDVRQIQDTLKSEGVSLMNEVQTEKGAGSFMFQDPDGNVILMDQHVD